VPRIPGGTERHLRTRVIRLEYALVPLSNEQFIRRSLIVLALIGLAIIVWRLIDVLLVIFAATIFAVILRSSASLVQRFTRLRGSWALAASALALALLLLGFASLIGWRIADQLGDLTQALTHGLSELRGALEQSRGGRALLAGFSRGSLSAVRPLPSLESAASDTFGVLVGSVVIVFVGVFLAVDPWLYKRGVLRLAPRAQRQALDGTLDAAARTLRQWLGGVLVAMLVVGVITGLGLWLLGIRLALSLGFLAGLLEIVPYVGPIVSAVPATLVGFTAGPVPAMEVVGLFLIVHLLEGYVLIPLVQKRAVALPPALAVTAVVIFGTLLGPLGVVLAHPLMITLIVFIERFYLDDEAPRIAS
jgi:predicted PurR-regulated permease PerM